MKLKLGVVLSLLLMLFFGFFVWEARDWRFQARLYPWAIGLPMLALALVQLILELKGRDQKITSTEAPVDFQFSQTVDRAVARHRTINVFSWIFGFLMAIWLIGFSAAVPLLVLLYLRLQSREGRMLSLVLTAAAWIVFWGLFIRLLRLPFPEGVLITWLGL